MQANYRRLFSRTQAIKLLQVGQDAFQKLIDTQQLPELRVCNEIRFDSRDIYLLIDTYRSIATRRFHEPS